MTFFFQTIANFSIQGIPVGVALNQVHPPTQKVVRGDLPSIIRCVRSVRRMCLTLVVAGQKVRADDWGWDKLFMIQIDYTGSLSLVTTGVYGGARACGDIHREVWRSMDQDVLFMFSIYTSFFPLVRF